MQCIVNAMMVKKECTRNYTRKSDGVNDIKLLKYGEYILSNE